MDQSDNVSKRARPRAVFDTIPDSGFSLLASSFSMLAFSFFSFSPVLTSHFSPAPPVPFW
jgi:hypothetical protein